jgi:hypothetical protein
MYISYEDLEAIRENVDIRFEFNKTKKEIQRDMLEFINFVNSNQLSQVSVNMTDVARQLAVAFDVNPAVVMKQSLDPLQTLQSINTRAHVYYDPAKSPSFTDKFNQMYYKIDTDTLKDMQNIENIKTEHIVKRESAKTANQGKADILKKSHEKSLDTISPEELAQTQITENTAE